MYKGIYNEGEFYTSFYFENKLSTDLLSKVDGFSRLKERVDQFKSLNTQYWEMTDEKKLDFEKLLEFYQQIIQVLNFTYQPSSHVNLNETNISTIANIDKNSTPEFLFFLTDQREEGGFETSPLSLSTDEEINNDERDFNKIISEYFNELENPPKWIIVGAPTMIFLLERTKWSKGYYLKFNLDEIFQQRSDKLISSIIGLLSKDSICPDSGISLHDEIDDNSHRQAHEVTTELRESVRESIELLINEMIVQRKKAHEAYMSKSNSDDYAKELSHDALFYVYRLIFLLYLESQGEDSDLLPLKSGIYRHGYSLEKLLELIHDIPDEKTKDFEGSFIHESLEQIFSLIYNGFSYSTEKDLFNHDEITSTGFLLKGIKSDLFDPSSIKHLKGIKLRNGVLLQILHKLSLSTIGKGKNKKLTRVSYSNLGINQLGAVYEGLLSYSGFFASEELHALKPAKVKQSKIDLGQDLDQVYLAPKSLVEKYKKTKDEKYKITKDNIVLGEDGNPKIYKKGSFIYRLAGRDRQKLASYYTPESLTKCTVKYSLKVLFETKNTLDDLWKVKILEPAMGSGAFLNEAVNQLSDKILELEVENKIGILKTPKDKQRRLYEIKYKLISENVYGVDLNPTAIELARFSLWLNCIGAGQEPPNFDGKLKIGNSLIGARFKKGDDGIYPWLLLDKGMLNYGKRLKDYDPDGFKAIHDFRKDFLKSKLDSSDDIIVKLQVKTEVILNDLINGQAEKVKDIAYDKLKSCGDLWCSLFFLTADDIEIFPDTHEDLCNIFTMILDGDNINKKLTTIINKKYENERFFHWELEYPEIIASGGFDLILGNPPWVAVEWKEGSFISDTAPIPSILGLDSKNTSDYIHKTCSKEELNELSLRYITTMGYIKLLEVNFYKVLSGISKNTYKHFIILSFWLSKVKSVVGLIHEDGIYEDQKGDKIREKLYHKLRYHFNFVNQKYLFSEIGNTRSYSVNISEERKDEVNFCHISNLFVTSTVDSTISLLTQKNTNNELPPGIKNDNHEWETRGHKDRAIFINQEILHLYSTFNQTEDTSAPPLLNLHLVHLIKFIKEIASPDNTINSLAGSSVVGGGMLEAKSALENNIISASNLIPTKINQVVLSSPQISNATIFGQETKEQYDNHRSYQSIDLEDNLDEWLPRTLYVQNIKAVDSYLKGYKLNNKNYRSFWRFGYRRRFDVQSERCFYPAIIPPGVSHIDLIESFAIGNIEKLIFICANSLSLLYEGIARVKNLKDCRYSELKKFPIAFETKYKNSIIRRMLWLTIISKHFHELSDIFKEVLIHEDSISTSIKVDFYSSKMRTKLKKIENRKQIMIEIDALIFLSLNLDKNIYYSIYETLVPVMKKYDKVTGYNRIDNVEKAMNFFQKRGW